jgi:hypothetical protein
MASAASGRGTWSVLAGLIDDELVEIGVGEPHARALLAVTDDDIAKLARVDVGVERLDGAAELGSGLRLRA